MELKGDFLEIYNKTTETLINKYREIRQPLWDKYMSEGTPKSLKEYQRKHKPMWESYKQAEEGIRNLLTTLQNGE